jgi:hypothetical protein
MHETELDRQRHRAVVAEGLGWRSRWLSCGQLGPLVTGADDARYTDVLRQSRRRTKRPSTICSRTATNNGGTPGRHWLIHRSGLIGG